jgi:hypothetical protein
VVAANTSPPAHATASAAASSSAAKQQRGSGGTDGTGVSIVAEVKEAMLPSGGMIVSIDTIGFLPFRASLLVTNPSSRPCGVGSMAFVYRTRPSCRCAAWILQLQAERSANRPIPVAVSAQ